MKGALVIYRRELASLFLSPLAWILLFVALLVNGLFLYVMLGNYRGDVGIVLETFLGGGWNFWMMLVFLPPLLTMRLLSEEARSGTLEFLLTAPVTDAGVVFGKFLAATTFMALLWTSVLVYAVAIHMQGVSPDWGAVLGGYLGAVLSSGLFVAIGLCASSLTPTPLIAAFLAFMACLWWLILPRMAEAAIVQLAFLLQGWIGDVAQATEWLRTMLHQMNVLAHFQSSFLNGVFDTAEIVFFLTWIAFFLFLTVRSVETRRWRV